MKILPEELKNYVHAHTTEESQALYELNWQTNLKVSKPQMLSGHLQGQVLRMISRMIQPQNVLEIGTYTGYSAICLAAGISADGKVHTIDNNEELESMAREYWKKAGVQHKIRLYTGNALDIIPKLDQTFDLAFIDADKVNYANYYDMILPKLRNGGFILTDNVLWGGRVLQPNGDEDTQAIKKFNEKIHNDTRVDNVLLPVRDGVMIIHKIFCINLSRE